MRLSQRLALRRMNRAADTDPITQGQITLCALHAELSRLAGLVEIVGERSGDFTPSQSADLLVWASAAQDTFEHSKRSIARLSDRVARILS